MKRRILNLLPLVTSPLLLLPRIQEAAAQATSDRFFVFPRSVAEPGEYVVTIAISLVSAIFDTIPRIPLGWSAAVDNNASLQAELRASAGMGAASYRSGDPKAFGFIIRRILLEGLDFDATMTFGLTKDFKTSRLATLTQKELNIDKI